MSGPITGARRRPLPDEGPMYWPSQAGHSRRSGADITTTWVGVHLAALAQADGSVAPEHDHDCDGVRLALAELHNAVSDPRPSERLINAMKAAREVLAR